MSGSDTWNDIASELARLTGTHAGDWLPVAKARYGMYAVFDALRDLYGCTGTVLTQLYTCVTAVDPILFAGFVPNYGEIDPHTLSLDMHAVDTTLGESAPASPRAVIIQHTFGIIDNASSIALAAQAHKRGALVMEDCAHCLGRMAYGSEGLPVADVSVHSFGVEKMVRSSFGGAIWVNPALEPRVRESIRSKIEIFPVVSGIRALAIHSYPVAIRVLARLPKGFSQTLRRTLARIGLFELAVNPDEQRGGMSSSALPDAWIYRHMHRALNGYEKNLDVRRSLVDIYRSTLPLAPLGALVHQPLECPNAVLVGDAQPLLAFPVYLENETLASTAVRKLREAGFYARAWYRPLLFPGVENTELYHVDSSVRYPLSERCSQGAVLLPVDLDEERTRAAAHLLKEIVGI